VAEKPEHPAAKAGRYVRAAGIVLGKEIDRRAAAAAAKPVPVRAEPLPPPPPVATANLIGKAMFGLFVVALVILGATILHFVDLVPGSSKGSPERVTRLVLAAILFTEGYFLVSNWRKANERIGQRLLNRMFGMQRGAVTRREKFFARGVRDVLTLVGIGFLAGGVFDLLVALLGNSI
jgi:hypothetical protein